MKRSSRLGRKEKEALYRRKMTQLQIQWKNPLDGDWDFVERWSDDELTRQLNDTVGQLRYEKFLGLLPWIFGGLLLLMGWL